MASGTNRTSVQSRLFALAALSTGFGMISSAFGFYYVKVFLNVYHIKENWFQVSQTLFLIWNAINDPLFAYFQDNTSFRCTRTRRESVLYAAPFFALSFLVPWFPWGDTETLAPWVTGIHLITSLCFWDTMFTFVGLAYCALFTEIAVENEDRLRMVRYAQIGSLIGSSSIFILQTASSQLEYFRIFQTVCVVLAVISCLLMRYCGKHAHTERDLKKQMDADNGQLCKEKSEKESYITITKQILFNRDFLAFVIMNFFQEFHRTFHFNFLAIFCDQLIVKGTLPNMARSIFYGGSHMIAKVMVILGTPIVSRYGYFNVIRYSYVLKIVIGFVYFITGPINHWVLMLFLLVDGSAADGIFALFNLPLSDIADSDTVRHNRRHPMTSMVYGTNALVVKPAISLSPMFVVAILNSYGYEKLKDHSLDPNQIGILNSIMFSLICLFPLILGSIQLFCWSFYTIRHKKNVDMTIVISGENSLQ